MNDLNSPAPPPGAAQRPVTPAPVTGDSTPHGQTPRQSDGQAPPREQPEANPNPAVTISASLAGMSAGTLVDAMVVGADPDGVPVVQAAGGTFLAVTKTPLPAHTALTLLIKSTGTEIRAFITQQNGEERRPPIDVRLVLTEIGGGANTTYGQPAAAHAPPTGVPAGTANEMPPASQPLVPGLRLTARVIAAPSTPAAPPPGGAGAPDHQSFPAAAKILRPGLPLLVRILEVGPPGTPAATGAPVSPPGGIAQPGTNSAAAAPGQSPGSTPGPTTAQTVSAETGSPAQSTARGAAQAEPAAAPRPGTQSPANAPAAAPVAPSGETPEAIKAKAAPSVSGRPAPGLQAAAPTQAFTLTAVVSGHSPEGQTLLLTAAGTIQVEAALAAADGTEVTIEALQPAAPFQGAASAVPSSPQAALVDFAAGWSALRELVTVVQASDPGVASQFVKQRIPSLNARSASNVLFFVSALRGGDVQGWLGADMSKAAERAGLRRLIDRLSDDFIQLRSLIDADGDDEWRALPFPFFDGDQIEPIMMFVRGRRAKKEEDEDDVRFIVDLELSALGTMQLDGLVQTERFDLIVRSKKRLGEKIIRDIRSLFESGLETTGLKGKIVFQNVATFPASPLSDFVGTEHAAGEIVA